MSTPIRITAFLGSARDDNYTRKALEIVADEINRDPKASVEIIDPRDYQLAPPGPGQKAEVMEELQKKVRDAAAIVLSTPEYHGSYSSVIKMTIEHLGFPSALAGKPVLLVGVAAGVIGAIKATEHLRSVASHVGANVLPGAVSLANVQKAFDADGTLQDPAVEKRLRAAGRSLIDYLEQNVCPRLALEQMVRENSGESE